MRLKDAVKSLQVGKEKDTVKNSLCTVWSEAADDGPDAVPLPEYPRPQLTRKEWICLNGWWDYAVLPSGEKYRSPDGKILVPFSPETVRSGVKRTLMPGETLWYVRRIPGITLEKGRRLLLHFGAVDERCAVFWNGRKTGTHRGGYLPFCFDVTEYVSRTGNELKVCVRDDTDQSAACRGKQTLSPGGMYYQAQSGIWQTVWLEIVPETWLADLRITPLPESGQVRLQLRWENAGRRDEDVHTEAAALNNPEKDEAAPENMGTYEAVSGNSGVYAAAFAGDVQITLEGNVYTFPLRKEMDVRLPAVDLQLWSPENPVLHAIHIRAGEDEADSYFAMRSFGTGKDEEGRPCLTLNGKPYFFNGVLDQGYWPESLMTPPADEAMIFDIAEMKRLSFNMIRKHVKIEPARWYYHCDRLGMVVWQDMINGGGPVNRLLETWLPTVVPAFGKHVNDRLYRLFSRENARVRRQFEEDLIRMIRYLYSVPCIGLWTVFNEGWGQFDALRLCGLVKEEDPTRPVDHASGWFDQGGGDIRSIHNYFRKLRAEPDERACVISEYGGYTCAVEGHTMSSAVYGYRTCSREEYPSSLKTVMDEIRTLAGQGLSGAVYTQVSDIEEEINGLLTWDRKVCKAEV